MERKNSEKYVKRLYVSGTEDPKRGERPVVKGKDSVKEYMQERVADREGQIELGSRECVDRERWKPSPCGAFLEGARRQRL